MLHRIALAGALALFVTIASCRPAQEKPPEPAGQAEIDRIATVGHGMAFDAEMKRIPMDLKTIQAMQGSLAELFDEAKVAEDDATRKFAAGIEAAMAETGIEEERALLNAALLGKRLERADDKMRMAYDWRNRYLAERIRGLLERRFRAYALSEAIQRWLRESGLIRDGLVDTDYMDECRAESVPVPPDFSMAGATGWIRQGTLTYNILEAGGTAEVWTWTDPALRGACVALPRDNGGPGSGTGIICQSATTGKACFWDNMTRADPARRIPAATETMVIRELQDGRTLDQFAPCSSCHSGNNAFLLAPDDATWAKLMRGPLNGPQPAGNVFTTIVEPQTDSPGGPRYTPIAAATWSNPPLASGCAGACHAAPSSNIDYLMSFLTGSQRPPMPPACATGGNYRNCYGVP